MIKIEISNIDCERPVVLRAMARLFDAVADSAIETDVKQQPVSDEPNPEYCGSHPEKFPIPDGCNIPHNTKVTAEAGNIDIDECPATDISEGFTYTDAEVDQENLPWDHRIHARTKTKTQGVWRLMRGVDPKLVQTVKAEMAQVMQLPRASIAPPPSADFNPFNVPETVLAEGTNAFDPQPDFPAFMSKITVGAHSGKITPAKVLEIVNSFGLPSIHTVATRVDLIPQIMEKLDEILK